MNTDGWVVIGTKLDDSGFDKGIKKIQNTEVKTEVEVDPDLQGYELLAQMARQKAAELSQEAEITPSVNLQNIDNQLSEAYIKSSELINKLMEVSMEPSDDMRPLLEVINELDSVSNIIEELDAKREKLTGHVSEDVAEIKKGINSIKASSKDINTGINNIGNGLSNVAKKVGRWALAVVGVSGAYMAVRRAISIVSAQNEKVANSFEQIQKVIAGALLPVVQTVINFIVKIMYYINYIWKFFTGKNLFNFADATKKSAKELRNASKSTGKISKDLKDAKKQLAGFDEMNVLQEPSDNTGSSGSGGAGDPEFANIFDKLKGVKIPDWLKWLLNHGEVLKTILEALATAFIMLKTGLSGFSKGLGIFLVLDGILNLCKDLKAYIADPNWENFANVLRDIGEILVGFAFILGITTPLGVVLAIIGQIIIWGAGAIKVIKGIEAWLKKPTWENFKKIWLSSIESAGIVGLLIKKIFDLLGGFDKIVEPIHKYYDWFMQTFIPNVKEGFENTWKKIKEVFSPIGKFFKETFGTAYKNIKIIVDDIKILFSAMWTSIKKVFEPVVKFFKDKFDKVYSKIKEALKPVVDYFDDLWTKIKGKLKEWGTKAGKAIGGALQGAINAILGRIEDILNKPVNAINGLINKVKKIPGLQKLQTLNTFKLPRLAKGGIINMPGRGVPLALGGESGAEGVIPLTDNQQMELLGEAIGKYITINATITNTMNGRVISRELKKVQNDSDFAFNR